MSVTEICHGDVHVYIMNICDMPRDIPISPYRQERISGIKNEKLIKQSLGAEAVLNYAVKALWGTDAPVEYYGDSRGKPFFSYIDGFFSLSHSGDYAVCALAPYPVGVDIQTERSVSEQVRERVLTDREKKFLKENPTESFSRIWARKEAVSKASGEGLQMGFSTLDVLQDTKEYIIYDVQAPRGYVISAAIMSR